MGAADLPAQDSIKKLDNGRYSVPASMLVDMQHRAAEADSLEERTNKLYRKTLLLARDTTMKRRRIEDLIDLSARYDSLLDESQENNNDSFVEELQDAGLYITAGFATCEAVNR